jgi:hypothetical protein
LGRLRARYIVVEETPFGAVMQKTTKIRYFLSTDPDLKFLVDQKSSTKRTQVSCGGGDPLQETKRGGDMCSPRTRAGDPKRLSRGYNRGCRFAVELPSENRNKKLAKKSKENENEGEAKGEWGEYMRTWVAGWRVPSYLVRPD